MVHFGTNCHIPKLVNYYFLRSNREPDIDFARPKFCCLLLIERSLMTVDCVVDRGVNEWMNEYGTMVDLCWQENWRSGRTPCTSATFSAQICNTHTWNRIRDKESPHLCRNKINFFVQLIAVCSGCIREWVYQRVGVSEIGCIREWVYQRVGVSDSRCIREWVYQTVGVSESVCIRQ